MQPTSADLASQLATYDSKPVTSTDALNSALTQYGVPEIRNTVSGLRTTVANTTNALNNVDPSVTGRTQGSLVTEAQREKQVANESAPIAGQLKDQTGALGQNEQDLTDALGQANTQATNQVNDYNSGRTALQNEYTTAYQREQDAAAAQLAASQDAEKEREFNVSAAQSSNANNPAAGYSVKQLGSGNLAYTGPNGTTNLYQYAQALNGGNSADPDKVLDTIQSTLAGGSATDKGAANGIAKLKQQGLTTAQIVARLKSSNGYIFS